MSDETPWQAGRFDVKQGPRKLLFGRMYEDPEIEASVFPPGGRIFAIASAGCTAIALADRCRVTAVDINPVQLAYAARRLAGAPMEAGSAERAMRALRRLAPLAGWRREALLAFLDLEDPAEQVEVWRSRLATARFRFGIDVGLSITALGAVYASPFLRVLPPRFGRVMLGRMERCFATHPNRTNPYARALLLGDLEGPIASRPRDVELCESDAAAYLEASPPGSFDGFTLSNIVDGAPPAYIDRLLAAVARAAAPGAMVVVRSFAEPTSPSQGELAARDRSLLWGVVEVRPARPGR
jgi:S-adenosylmethionine:diacylglycerol 3-amino-3-carboxypropyl transferase